MSIPFDLKQNVETGNAILFVGAGMGYNMLDENGQTVPDGKALGNGIAKNFNVPVDGDADIEKVSQYVIIQRNGRNDLYTYIRSVLTQVTPDLAMQWIPTVKWKAIFTTNYDDSLEKAYDHVANPAQQYKTVTHSTGIPQFDNNFVVPIIHLHGALFTPDSPDIIITRQDFVKYKEKRASLFGLLKIYMTSSMVLYTGYSHNDHNFYSIIDELESELYPEKPKRAYRIDPNTSQVDAVLLEARNIFTIHSTFSDFVFSAIKEIKSFSLPDLNLQQYADRIPIDFQAVMRSNPVTTIRFFSSWDYLNQLSINHGKSAHEFLRGDKADWNIIFTDQFFRRSIEEEIYETLLDNITEPKTRVRVSIVLGSAGYGTTTLLMSLAKRLVDSRAAEVFFHNDVSDVREGDILFACERTPESKHVFFIDNATSHASIIRKITQMANERKLSCTLVLGARINEWHQKRIAVYGVEFQILPLDDSEIELLLDFLGRTHELNQLAPLTREQQIAAIKRNYNRELLVAIREATEGRNFDAIIEGEYYGINDDFSRKVYCLLACFHQHNALLRVDLLASLMGVTVVELYEKIRTPLEGIVYFEETQDGVSEYAARTRHRIIANIIWNRCVSSAMRDELIHNVLDSLNISLRLDYEAFQCFVSSDQMVDSLASDESKQRFFEKACKYDPDNPYVRQHYARMLLRIKRPLLALGIIEQALIMDNSKQILHHTKGIVLQHLAFDADNEEVARRYIGLSEQEFLLALSLNIRDSYCYQGLASLYLGWAKKTKNDDEETLYLAKTEEIIEKGLRTARDKESIWISSSNLNEYLGDMPGRINSLIRAVENAPTSILSRYLLAKAYILDGKSSDAKELLKQIVYEMPDEYKSTMEYAKVLLLDGASISQSIATLQQSTLFGYSDPRFVAMLGGLLFLQKRFDDAERVFSESAKRQFIQINTVYFKPQDCGIASEYEATVSYVGAGYSYVVTAGFPSLRCGSSKYNDVLFHVGTQLRISIQFSARQPIAQIVEIIKP